MFLIMCDSQEIPGVRLFLADRKKTKDQWWTSALDLALIYNRESAAKVHSQKYRFNNPTVIAYSKAKSVASVNRSIQENFITGASEDGK